MHSTQTGLKTVLTSSVTADILASLRVVSRESMVLTFIQEVYYHINKITNPCSRTRVNRVLTGQQFGASCNL